MICKHERQAKGAKVCEDNVQTNMALYKITINTQEPQDCLVHHRQPIQKYMI